MKKLISILFLFSISIVYASSFVIKKDQEKQSKKVSRAALKDSVCENLHTIMVGFSGMLKTFAELHEKVVGVVSGVVLSDDAVLKNSTNERLQRLESVAKKYQEAVYKAEEAARELKSLLQ